MYTTKTTKAELLELANAMGVEGTEELTKAQLQAAIDAATPDVDPDLEGTENVEPEFTDEEVEAARTELQALQERIAELQGVLATRQPHILYTSTVQKPVQLVREIFLGMLGERRRDVIAKCVNAGIAANTAKTQYQRLKKMYEAGDLAEDIEALQANCEG